MLLPDSWDWPADFARRKLLMLSFASRNRVIENVEDTHVYKVLGIGVCIGVKSKSPLPPFCKGGQGGFAGVKITRSFRSSHRGEGATEVF